MYADHTHPKYREILRALHPSNRRNGAFYYSQEIMRNIYPRVETRRGWLTVNIPGIARDHDIVFIHNNLNPDRVYQWLADYQDLVLVCAFEQTAKAVEHLGRTIVLPLSIDTEYVKKFRTKKTVEVAFAGRPEKKFLGNLPYGVPCYENLKRNELLEEMAKAQKIYAVGRTALEAKVLGAEILPYDRRYPDPEVWQVIDNREAANLLQTELDKIDGGKHGTRA